MTAFSTAPSWRRICFCWCGRKNRDDAVDRLRRVQGVQRREHEVAGLGGGEGRLDRLVVAHLTDQDDVGVLAQGAAQGQGESLRVDVDLALVDDRLLVAVEKLDRVLDRHHVLVAGRVDVVDHRGEGGRLARAGRPGAEDQAPLLVTDLLQHGREEQLLDRQDFGRDDAQNQAHRAPLLEDVAPEAAEVGHVVRDVDLEVVLELFLLPGRHDREGHRDRVFLHQAAHVCQRDERSVDADDGKGANLQVEVRRLALDRNLQQIVDMHDFVSSVFARLPLAEADWKGLGAVGTALAAARGERPTAFTPAPAPSYAPTRASTGNGGGASRSDPRRLRRSRRRNPSADARSRAPACRAPPGCGRPTGSA